MKLKVPVREYVKRQEVLNPTHSIIKGDVLKLINIYLMNNIGERDYYQKLNDLSPSFMHQIKMFVYWSTKENLEGQS